MNLKPYPGFNIIQIFSQYVNVYRKTKPNVVKYPEKNTIKSELIWIYETTMEIQWENSILCNEK